MKAQIAAKYIQFLSNKKANKNSGFTLIELLVVIIIIGILSAIALPSFLNQAAKARGAEAKSNVGALNRGQQAYFLEQQSFTIVPEDLGLSLDLSTENYIYTSVAGTRLAPTTAAPTAGVENVATSQKPDIKGYRGGTFYIGSTATVQGNTKTILCEAKKPGSDAAVLITAITAPVAAGDEATCPDARSIVVK